jgi:hypothetical protein
VGSEETIWLNLTNAALGLGVAACLLAILFALLCDVVDLRRKRHSRWAAMEREMEALWRSAGRKIHDSAPGA